MRSHGYNNMGIENGRLVGEARNMCNCCDIYLFV